jgi:hypothetical protein
MTYETILRLAEEGAMLLVVADDAEAVEATCYKDALAIFNSWTAAHREGKREGKFFPLRVKGFAAEVCLRQLQAARADGLVGDAFVAFGDEFQRLSSDGRLTRPVPEWAQEDAVGRWRDDIFFRFR